MMTARASTGLLLALLVGGHGARAADSAADTAALVGSWELVSLENRGADGSVHHPFGKAPVGRITYTADGRMMAQIMRDERQPFATSELYSGTQAEKAAAYDSYVAYYGTYAVDAATHTVTHKVTASLFPNWVGGDQQRFYALDGDALILSTKPFPAQGTEVTAHVVWRRTK